MKFSDHQTNVVHKGNNEVKWSRKSVGCPSPLSEMADFLFDLNYAIPAMTGYNGCVDELWYETNH